jgi:hypothetical protein
MMDLVRHKIKNHPIVLSAYVNFLARHTPIGKVHKLREDFKTMSILVKSAQAKSKKANNVASEASKKMK